MIEEMWQTFPKGWQPQKMYFDHVNHTFVAEEPSEDKTIVLGFTLAVNDMPLDEFEKNKHFLIESVWQAKELGCAELDRLMAKKHSEETIGNNP